GRVWEGVMPATPCDLGVADSIEISSRPRRSGSAGGSVASKCTDPAITTITPTQPSPIEGEGSQTAPIDSAEQVHGNDNYPTTRHSWMSWPGATSSNVTSTAAPTGAL